MRSLLSGRVDGEESWTWRPIRSGCRFHGGGEFLKFQRPGRRFSRIRRRVSSKIRPGPTNILRNDNFRESGDGGITMGLDIALGILILIAAIRGWIKGFVYQTIRLGGLVACFYLADPVRDQAKPHVVRYLSSVPRELLDPLLWWVAAALSYVVVVGVTTLFLKITKRPEVPGLLPQRSRHDQFAGFLLGIARGAVYAAFVTAGIQMFVLKHLAAVPWATAQARQSWALRLDHQYHPAERIWKSPPVQHLVNHIQRMGYPHRDDAKKPEAQDDPIAQTANREGAAHGGAAAAPIDENATGPPAPPPIEVPTHRAVDPDLEKTIAELKATIEAAARSR